MVKKGEEKKGDKKVQGVTKVPKHF